MDVVHSSSPYMTYGQHHVIPPPPPPGVAAPTHILQPKSTIASILLEPGTGKTTVLGTLVPAESHMLDSFSDAAEGGVEALARAVESVQAVLDVHVVLGSSTVGFNGALDDGRERQVLRALGLVGYSDVSDVEDMSMPLVKSEPDWTDSSYTPYESSSIKHETSDPSSSRVTTPRAAAFRPFRPTCSKMAIFESQSQSRKAGMNGRRRHHPLDPAQTSPSNIFSRTRSRTRLGMGSMLEQVANVDNVVRLARKNPSALVERFLSGYTATSPVKQKGNGNGFTIDARPRLSARLEGSVKTLNIATGSSKKRKVVSVVLDDAGRPVRWGAGTVLPPVVAVAPVNHVLPPTTTTTTTTTGPVKASLPRAGAASTGKSGGKNDSQSQFGRNLPICSNCGITESNTWRTKGKGGVRVCNGESNLHLLSPPINQLL
jgi:hypothetical protein